MSIFPAAAATSSEVWETYGLYGSQWYEADIEKLTTYDDWFHRGPDRCVFEPYSETHYVRTDGSGTQGPLIIFADYLPFQVHKSGGALVPEVRSVTRPLWNGSETFRLSTAGSAIRLELFRQYHMTDTLCTAQIYVGGAVDGIETYTLVWDTASDTITYRGTLDLAGDFSCSQGFPGYECDVQNYQSQQSYTWSADGPNTYLLSPGDQRQVLVLSLNLPTPMPDGRLHFRDPLAIAGFPKPSEQAIHASPVEAVGAVADGLSVGIVEYEADSPEDVVLSLCEGPACTASGPAYGALFSLSELTDQGLPQGGSTEKTVTPQAMGDGRFSAFAAYRAPAQLPISGSAPAIFYINAIQGSTTTSRPVTLKAPPVLLIHGIWSQGSTWDTLAAYLQVHHPSAGIATVDYKAYSAGSFAADGPQSRLRSGIQESLQRARSSGVIATQVDIVAHSMGGLVTRYYSGTDPINARNYKRGHIHSLITVGTPHLGSPLATWILAHENSFVDPGSFFYALFQDPTLTLGEVMAFAGKDVAAGGVAALRDVGNPAITTLFNPSLFRYSSLLGIRPNGSSVERFYDAIASSFDGRDGGVAQTTETELLGTRHDTLVTEISQGGSSCESTPICGVVHTGISASQAFFSGAAAPGETDSALVRSEVLRRLQRAPCTVSSAGETCSNTSITTTAIPGSLAEIDFRNLRHRDSSEISVQPPSGTVLYLNQPVTLSLSTTTGQLVRIVFVSQSMVYDITTPPLTLSLRPKRLGTAEVRAIALFDDNSYATALVTYGVQDQGPLTGLAVNPRDVSLLGIGATSAIQVSAVFSDGLADIRDLATYSVRAGGTVVTVSSTGDITAIGYGSAVIDVAFEEQTTSVRVQVVNSDGSPPSGFYTVPPCRVIDTRLPLGPLAGPALSAGVVRRFVVAATCGIPFTAAALSVNITITDPNAGGHLTLFPGGGLVPGTSTMNFWAGQTRANNAIVPLGIAGDLNVFSGQPTGQVQFILDVNGYFQ